MILFMLRYTYCTVLVCLLIGTIHASVHFSLLHTPFLSVYVSDLAAAAAAAAAHRLLQRLLLLLRWRRIVVSSSQVSEKVAHASHHVPSHVLHPGDGDPRGLERNLPELFLSLLLIYMTPSSSRGSRVHPRHRHAGRPRPGRRR